MTLERRTPLSRGKTPLPRSRLRARRPEPRRRDAPRWDASGWAEAEPLLQARAGGRCDCCGRPLVAVERHHRKRRRDGGDRLANVLLLLPECHRRWTVQPAQAQARGLIVPVHADPLEVPVLWHGKRLVLLGDDGSAVPTV